MAQNYDPALTVADLEGLRSSESSVEPPQELTLKPLSNSNELSSSLPSILKKRSSALSSESKKVLFSEPELIVVNEISSETQKKPETVISSSTCASSNQEIPIDPCESKEESLNTLSMLSFHKSLATDSLAVNSKLESEGILNKPLSQRKETSSYLDMRWKTNSIINRHSETKRFDMCASEVFRKKLNAYYIKDMKRILNQQVYELRNPAEPEAWSYMGEKNSSSSSFSRLNY
ncbi:unnamed protein product [Blepharisma stoltei]|uniref:Uncharacterized protein n=1 Tax=Blepharisma stoltei TaxID=1481888 RepID=A0AAU9JNT3_9CILI|nr:unnamed protein product [Blepharisma stoltei]